MWVVSMGIWMMMVVVMAVVMIMGVTVPVAMVVMIMAMIVCVQRRPRKIMLLAEFFVATGCIAITVAWAILQTATNTFHVMMVALLCQPHLILKSKHLCPVFAHLTVHDVCALIDLVHTINKGRNHQLMVVEITRLQKLYVRIFSRHLISMAMDAFHENAGE